MKPKRLSKTELERYRNTWRGRDLEQDEVGTLFGHIDALNKKISTLTDAVVAISLLTSVGIFFCVVFLV